MVTEEKQILGVNTSQYAITLY